LEINELEKVDEPPRASTVRLFLAMVGASVFATLFLPVFLFLLALAAGDVDFSRMGLQLEGLTMIVMFGGPIIAMSALLLGLPAALWLIEVRCLTGLTVAIAGAVVALISFVLLWHWLGCWKDQATDWTGVGVCRDGHLTLASWINVGVRSLAFMAVGAAAALVGLGLYRLMGGDD
jgi:hypothetical protein